MKHIRRKFFFQKIKKNNPKPVIPGIEYFTLDHFKDQKELAKQTKNKNVYLETEDEIIGTIVCKVDGLLLPIPVIDPTLIYFNNAQLSIAKIVKYREELKSKLNLTKGVGNPPIHELYSYFGEISAFVIFLFTSIESFINRSIPENYLYKEEQKAKTIIYNKNQAQQYLDFRTKLTKIMREVKGKCFFNRQTPTNQLIWKLKEFRDDIIHTKQSTDIFKYENLLKTSFSFSYEKALHAVAAMINFYEPDYIVECGCGADF